jgi:branched-chain amino acid transport system substrate-binding protein
VARAYVASGAPLDIERLKRALRTAAATGYGATGWTVLNEAGDRRYGNFDLWAERLEGGVPRRAPGAKYITGTGIITRPAKPE